VGGHLALSLYSSDNPGEMVEGDGHEDRTLTLRTVLSSLLLLLFNQRLPHYDMTCYDKNSVR